MPRLSPWALWGLALLASAPLPAAAGCMAIADPGVRQLQRLSLVNARQALGEIQSRLAAANDGAAGTADAGVRASLYAVQAEAYEILERAAEARTAAAQGLALATRIDDPVHLELLAAYAEDVYDEAGIAEQIRRVEAARAAQPADSRAAMCLLLTRGVLEHRQNRADLAIITLSKAYRDSASPALREPHVMAAAALSAVMRVMGDFEQALALNQEELDWDIAQGATLSLSVAHFMRGHILKLMARYQTALVEFMEARRLSVSLADDQGVAFADLGICEAHIALGDFAAAKLECASARSAFAGVDAIDSVKEAEALQARIDLGLGRPEAALVTLNHVLDHDGVDLPPRNVATLYDSRARANAALHNYRDAYSDLREFVSRFTAADDAERRRQAGALRARFETDREIERNESLKRELAISQDQATRQARQLRWNALVAATGVVVIALLIYFLITNIRFRKKLVQLAAQDGLTGLPNRRRIAEFATAAIATANATREPFTLALIDLDHFKILNDCCGHATGDHVLKEFARVSTEALRECDLLGRWGGEEFLLVMPNSTLEVGAANLERLRTLMYGIRLPPSGAALRVSLSAGLAALDPTVRTLDELVARADAALYGAKSAGRDQVRIADNTQITGSHAARRLQRQ